MANRTNTSRRSRKQTMNVGFHASNVARNRLTLPPLATVGIFSKGKSSSPIQLHQGQYQNARHEDSKRVPADFLGRNLSFRKRKTPPSASTSNRNVLRLLEPNHRALGERWTKSSHEKTSSKQDTNQVGLRLNKSIQKAHNGDIATIKKPTGPHNILSSQQLLAEVNPPGLCTQRTWNLETNKHFFSPEYRSATPYTWSVSEHRKSQIDVWMESTLLAVLHAGLVEADADQHTQIVDSGRRYYELKDLQEILEARKVKWTESVNIDCSVPCSSALPIPQSDYAASISPNGQRAGTYHVKNINEEDLENDEQVFQQLDLLFQEIVTPQEGEPTCEGEQLEIPPPRPGPLHTPNAEFENYSPQNAMESRCDRRHMSPCNKIAPEDDTSASLRETYSIVQTRPPLRTSSICNNNKGFPGLHLGEYTEELTLKQNSGQTEGNRRGTLQTARPIPDPQTTIPLGFWRQNKLY